MSEQRDNASQPQHSTTSSTASGAQNPQHDAHQLRQSQVLPYPGFQQSGYAHILAGSNSSSRPYGYPDSQYQGYVQQPQQSASGASAYVNGSSNPSVGSGSPQQQAQQQAQHQPPLPQQQPQQQPVQSQQQQIQQQQQVQQVQAQQAQLGYGNPYQSAYYMSTQPGQVQQQPDYASYASYARNYGYVAPTNYPVTAYSNAGTTAASGIGSMNGSIISQQAQSQIQNPTSGQFSSPAPSSMATIGQVQPAGLRPRITTTMWEDEKTLCYQVDANGVSVVRRADNNMINGTKLLNVARMTRGRRDGILKSEKIRHVVKIGSMHLKGVWIPFERALSMAQREKIVDLLYPLFVKDIKRVIQQGTPTNAIPNGSTSSSNTGPAATSNQLSLSSASSQPTQPAPSQQPTPVQQQDQAVQPSQSQPSQPVHNQHQVGQQQQIPLIQSGGYKQESQSSIPQQSQPDSASAQQANPYLHS
ncbi:unnamed protein product [Kuraishia capsulata CBS 1993]|uniref:HTH APSES-type domain-containing protein n=1 Tax=Kuraishia capsulata CBS 1993 TaxID=1382522 RepID=W6MSD9_9ASCO|nr:uncharacterized protein KUCA_T00004103001 [Kuraishia capsulata CBS 1993]CDK28122.1 unnamed protein product [Kuraishia capsulata CBS 1993]